MHSICGYFNLNYDLVNLIKTRLINLSPTYVLHIDLGDAKFFIWVLGVQATLRFNLHKWVFDCQDCRLPKKVDRTYQIGGKVGLHSKI